MNRVLVVTYYWPPSGGGGVQRWLKFCKYLPENGWKPIVFTPENPQFDQLDETLLKDVKDEIEVIKRPIWEPYSLVRGGKGRMQGVVERDKGQSIVKRLAVWIRGNCFIPDPRVFWVNPSIRFLKKYLSKNPVSIVITTGPPHSIHLIGLGLKKYFGNEIKWIADFRDPWSKWDILSEMKTTKISMGLHRYLERKVLSACNSAITVSETWRKDFKELGASSIHTITNGFDEDDFLRESETTSSDTFEIVHMGLINNLRSSKELWQAFNNVISASKDRRWRLTLGGMVSEEVKDFIHSLPSLSMVTEVLGYLSHDEVLERYRRASLLLLLTNQSNNATGHLPGKLFEYIGARKPILALAQKATDIQELIDNNKIGEVVAYDNQEQIEEALKSLVRKSSLDEAPEFQKQFTRRSLTYRLVKIMDSILL